MLRLVLLLVSFVVESCTADNPDYDPNFQPDASSSTSPDQGVPSDMGTSTLSDQYVPPPDIPDQSMTMQDSAQSPDITMGLEDLMAHQDQAMCVDKFEAFTARCEKSMLFNGSEFRMLFTATLPTFNRFQGGVAFWFSAGKCPADPRDVIRMGVSAGSFQMPLNANYSGIIHMATVVNGVVVPDLRFAGMQCVVPHYVTQCGDSLNYQPMDVPSVEVNCQ